jgi:guanosine-3',5'-bis(diphosphate) 3'-pyrophosphohydrolase
MDESPLLRDIIKDQTEVLNRYRALLRTLPKKADNKDKKMIREAFKLAMDAHKNVRRKSGEPYVIHPIEVAIIVSKEIGLGPTSIAASLLHDVVEDSDYTLNDIERVFGEKVARIIDGLTKISGVFDQNVSVQAENFRKMLLTIADDIRVILIKLADRLHNMRTMESMPAHKQLKIASETLFIFAPLAHRLGLHSIKTELEDLSLKYTEPEVYRDIVLQLKASRASEIKYLKRFSSRLRDALKREGVRFKIKERTKSIFSIRRKMVNQNISFDEVFDKFAIRIIVDAPPEQEKADCWKVYSVVTDFYRPNPDRLRDWISAPKATATKACTPPLWGLTGTG